VSAARPSATCSPNRLRRWLARVRSWLSLILVAAVVGSLAPQRTAEARPGRVNRAKDEAASPRRGSKAAPAARARSAAKPKPNRTAKGAVHRRGERGRDKPGKLRKVRPAPPGKRTTAKPVPDLEPSAADDPHPDPAGLPVAATWSELHRVVQLWRVGKTGRLAEELQHLQRAKDKDLAAAASHVLARVLARHGQGTAAAKALARSRIVADSLPAAHRWAGIEVAQAQGKSKVALDKLRSFRADFGSFRWAAADLLYSRLHEKVGPAEAAAQTALALYDKSAEHLPRDELLARAARVLQAVDRARSDQLWKKLILTHPESQFVDEAAERVALASLSDAEQFDRMVTLFSRRAYERCRSVGVQLWVKGYRRNEVGYFLGKIGSERLRDDYPGAAMYLAEAATPDAPLYQNALPSYALVLGKIGKTDEAIARYDQWLARFAGAKNDRRIDLHYDRARTLHMAGRSLQAARDLGAALDQDDKDIDVGKYRWFVGFWTLLGGRPAEAIDLLKPLMPNTNPLVGAKARYWVAKAQDRLGDRKAATETLLQLVDKYPLTYYSGLAENLLEDWGLGDKLPPREDFSKVPVAVTDPFAGMRMNDNLRSLRIACALGEPDVARTAWDTLQAGLRMELGAERLRKLRLDLSDALELFADARSDALRNHRDVLQRMPTRDTLAAWRGIYPRAFATHVVAAAERWGAPEWMVYAHMLQESAYRPELISGAPAYGLLELLDRTAQRLASEAREDYQLWMLMWPAHNVRWGTQYLAALYKKFHRQLPFAIASYNGGPMLLQYHMRQQHKLSRGFDEMIDDLGPHESRNYVRMVIGHFLRYLAIYEKPDRAKAYRNQLLPRAWQDAYLADPDY